MRAFLLAPLLMECFLLIDVQLNAQKIYFLRGKKERNYLDNFSLLTFMKINLPDSGNISRDTLITIVVEKRYLRYSNCMTTYAMHVHFEKTNYETTTSG